MFSRSMPDNVIKATLPKCPICGSEQIKTNEREFVKGIKESKPKIFKTGVVK